MFNSLRTRLIISYFFLILAVMLLVSYFLLDNLEEYYLAYQSEVLVRTAKLVADFTVPYLQGTPDVV